MKYDFAFIDGEHTFQQTLLDIALVARMMPKGGTIIAHDAISWPEVVPAIETLAEASPEIDYRIVGERSIYSRLHPRPPLSQILSIRKWNHCRLEKRRWRNHVPLPCDGLGIIKVRHGQKLSDLDLKKLLSKKDAMRPKKEDIVKQRILPNGSLDNFLVAG